MNPAFGTPEWVALQLAATLDRCHETAEEIAVAFKPDPGIVIDFDAYVSLELPKSHRKLWTMLSEASDSRPWLSTTPPSFTISAATSHGLWDKALESEIHEKCCKILNEAGIPCSLRRFSRN